MSKTQKICMFDIETTNLNADFGFMLCASWKFVGEKEVHTASIFDSPSFIDDPTDDKYVVAQVAQALNSSDVIVGHYSKRFDFPYIQARLLFHGLPTMDPRKPHVDTWHIARYKLKLHSNRLQSITEHLGFEDKTPIKSREWIRAMSGDVRAIQYVIDHCMTPDHKVLTNDLRYIPLGDIEIGDKLIAFDEEGPNRKYKEAIVTGKKVFEAPVYKVTLSSGKEFKVTEDHKWLVKNGNRFKWLETKNLRDKNAGIYSSKIPKLMPEWESRTDYDAGYLAGILDGEGTLGNRTTLHVAQRPGVVLDKILDLVGHECSNHTLRLVDKEYRGGLGRQDCHTVHLRGYLGERLALLGSIRPVRFLDKLDVSSFGRVEMRGEMDSVESIEYIGDMDVVSMQTDTKTFICEGYPHHNCEQDVLVLEHVYHKLKPLMTNHPNVNLVGGITDACPTCGSHLLTKQGWKIARVRRSQQYKCKACGSWCQGPSQPIEGVVIR